MDDLLHEIISLSSSIKKKREKEQAYHLQEKDNLQELLSALSHANDDDQSNVSITNLTREIEKLRVETDMKLKEMEKTKKEVVAEKDRNAEMMQQLQEKQTTSEKVYPRARYSVNLYRDISRIRWQTNASSNEIRGFTNGKSSAKTFKFDASKQSQFFITNSLWDMASE